MKSWIGRERLPLFAGILLAFPLACARQVVVPSPDPLGLSRVFVLHHLSLVQFAVRDAEREVAPEDAAALRRSFVEFLSGTGLFKSVTDSVGNPAPVTKPVLELGVVVHPSHTHRMTVLLDALFLLGTPFLVPPPGIWPITPWWGEADVSLDVEVLNGEGLVDELKAEGSAPYSMFFYSWYRTKPIEEAYREAYARAFEDCARKLEGEGGFILHRLALGHLDGGAPAAPPPGIVPGSEEPVPPRPDASSGP